LDNRRGASSALNRHTLPIRAFHDQLRVYAI
jgi:hypothetical protein